MSGRIDSATVWEGAYHSIPLVQPAGGTTLACAIKLIQAGKIPRDESICVCITGNGLKSIEVMQGQFAAAPVINAKMSECDKVVEQIAETAASAPAMATARV